MNIQHLAALTFAVQAAYGALESSPFLAYSTARPPWPTIKSQQLALAEDIQNLLQNSGCPSGDLILVHQAHLSTDQIQHMRLLRDRIHGDSNGTVVQVPNMLGHLDVKQLKSQIDARCSNIKTDILRVDTGRPHASEMGTVAMASIADSEIASLLAGKSKPYTIVLTRGSCASDEQHEPYTMDDPFLSPDHTDLRRDLSTESQLHRLAKDGANRTDNLPLFETYQFLSPAIFMGLGVSSLLLLILYVALSAISGMEVSYKAFSKEMGPQTQKAKGI